MGVRRAALPFEGHYTQIPNAWLRDERLSRKAKGLLGEIMSHRVGWRVSIRSLTRTGPEGRDAISTGLAELRECGYLQVAQGRSEGGRFTEVEYELCDPGIPHGVLTDERDDGDAPVTGFPVAADYPLTVAGFSVAGSSVSGSSATKKNISSEDHLEEPSLIAGDEVEMVISVDEAFDRFWAVWPRKKSRGDAVKAFGSLFSKMPAHRRAEWVDQVVLGVRRAQAEWRAVGRPMDKIPYPATWLRAEGWDDVPDQVVAVGVVDPDRKVIRNGRVVA